MQEKTRRTSGADEKTPSIPQYFSWVNNTNEGSTEAQTRINLDYFRWLHDTYGMELKIYAWDAGNLDGASGTYGFPGETPKLVQQYPNGYKPLADAAAEIGCHLGVWGGTDGFGNTPEEEHKRFETIVSLCRDLGFMLFKFDMVCGGLRPEKQKVFHDMIDTCRKYVPDLIVLNHRVDLGEAEICASTFLWGGVETYIDIHIHNDTTGSHHRVCTLQRGLVPEMKRLTEDHGVCLSSCLDYFEDDLINQAFARSLILAPEIYGNPWLLRDSEQAHLARIYNLHAKYRDILVNGMELPEAYGISAVSRGDETTRLLVMNNAEWTPAVRKVRLDGEIGLGDAGKQYVIKTLHPYESYVGTYAYGDTVEIRVEPCRAALILVQEAEKFMAEDFVLTGCQYETVYGKGKVPAKALVFCSEGEIGVIGALPQKNFAVEAGDNTIKAPVYLGTMTDCALPENAEALYEVTCFRADTDSLEAQSLKRSGKTEVPQVQKARDAFFGQDTYRYRGPENRFMFDNDPDTFYDGEAYRWGTRLDGGVLRVDLGDVYDVSRLEIECFEIAKPIYEVPAQRYPAAGTVSADLNVWKNIALGEIKVVCASCQAPVVKHSVHNIIQVDGQRKTAVYPVDSAVRYIRLPHPMERIYSLKVFDKTGCEIALQAPRANNMLAPWDKKNFRFAKAVTVVLPQNLEDGMYLAAAVNGNHGREGAYCAAMCGDALIGFDDRAIGYPVNNWEFVVSSSVSGYTYYLHLCAEMAGKEITVYTLLENEDETVCDLWLCDTNDKKPLGEISL